MQITATNIKPQIRERLDKGLDSQAFRGMAYEEHRLGDCAELRSFHEDYAWASNLLTRVRNQKPDQSEVKISGPQLAEMGLSYPGRTQVVAQFGETSSSLAVLDSQANEFVTMSLKPWDSDGSSTCLETVYVKEQQDGTLYTRVSQLQQKEDGSYSGVARFMRDYFYNADHPEP